VQRIRGNDGKNYSPVELFRKIYSLNIYQAE